MQNRGPGTGATSMERSRSRGSPAANNAGALKGAVPTHGAGGMGDRNIVGVRGASRAGSGRAIGEPVGYRMMPNAAAPGLSEVPDPPDPTIAVGLGQVGAGRFGAIRGVTWTFRQSAWVG